VTNEVGEEDDAAGEYGYEDDFVGVVGCGLEVACDFLAERGNAVCDCFAVVEDFVDVAVHHGLWYGWWDEKALRGGVEK